MNIKQINTPNNIKRATNDPSFYFFVETTLYNESYKYILLGVTRRVTSMEVSWIFEGLEFTPFIDAPIKITS